MSAGLWWGTWCCTASGRQETRCGSPPRIPLAAAGGGRSGSSPQERTPFNIAFDPGRSTTLILHAERLRGGEVIEQCEKTVCLATRELDGDFAALLWAGFGDDERYNRQNLALLRRLGTDAIVYAGANFREMCARANMRVLWNPDRVTGGSGGDFCKPEILERWRTLYREQAAGGKALAPLALTFGDETQYDWRSDGAVITSGPAYRDQDFRVFLGQLFGEAAGKLDLIALNKAWGTAFHAEDEIKVRSLDELRAAHAPAQWVCEGLWVEWQFHRLLAESKKAAEAEAPLSYYGDEGVCDIHTGDGHDYYLQGKDMTLYQCYDTASGAVSHQVLRRAEHAARDVDGELQLLQCRCR